MLSNFQVFNVAVELTSFVHELACKMVGLADARPGLELADRVGAMLYRLIA